jgi:3-deoxy-D-manno-octulosonic-acid transferase
MSFYIPEHIIMTTWKFLYNILVVPFLYGLFHLGKLFNAKIRRGIAGRRDLFEHLAATTASFKHKNRIWFHASSLGEFEQAKPIIVALKNSYPDVHIIVTFFSPSGYENSRNYKLADVISYIPFDTYRNAQTFLRIVQPTAAIILRYDVWPNMIWSLHERSVPAFIVNATMKKESPRLMPLVKQFHRALYNCFSHILTVSANDRDAFRLFSALRPTYDAIGDTRFDQVMSRSIIAATKNILPHSVADGKKILIIGQSWGEDESVVVPVILKMQEQEPSLLTFIVPHEPTIEHLDAVEQMLNNESSCIRFSAMNNYNGERIILVDSIGILVALYHYAHVVYIGGSFKQGIHNVLEPAVFGVPVLFGPKHTNSQEAVALVRLGGGFVVRNEKEMYRLLRALLQNDDERKRTGAVSQSFVRDHCGATDRFLRYLEPHIAP